MSSPRTALTCAVVLALTPAAFADPTVAAQAYRQAEDLVKQGKLAEACPLYAASFKEDQQLGALLHLADCNEKIGKTASAWAEWNDAAELARSRNDKRESTARARADALAGKLARLRINPPLTAVPGLTVRRDGEDITVLVGTDMPTDPGDHLISASAPGYKDWSTKVKIDPAPKTASLEIPDLEKSETPITTPDKPVVHDGHLKITTDPKADIYLDAEKVGTGQYDHDVRPGGHSLRISGAGMRTYQTELLVGDGEKRAIDVPLERDAGPVFVSPIVPYEPQPTVELALGTGAGVKMRNDNPAFASARIEIGFRLGRRVNFGIFAEGGNISTSDACGHDMPGAVPNSPYDYGIRLQFHSCRYFMPGFQLQIHVLPGKKIDPYVGISPGFRFGFSTWTPYLGAAPQMQQDDFFPGIVTGFRAGVDYHLYDQYKNWEVGGFIEDELMIIGDEAPESYRTKHSSTFLVQWIMAGVRSSVAF